jgi:beta-carotene 15,15'-dioxygenase
MILKIKTETILLLLGLLTLMIHNFIIPISYDGQIFILLGLTLTVGVPHGALDFLVDEQNAVVNNSTFSISKFLVVYLMRLFAFALLWFIPWLAGTLFIAFSIFHFGETDMSAFVKSNKRAFILYFSYGGFILSVLLLSHLPEIQYKLLGFNKLFLQNYLYQILLSATPYIVSFFGLALITCLFFEYKQGFLKKISLLECVQFALLIVVLVYLPLLLAFTFYFALWHSILSVRNIFAYLKNYNSEKKIIVLQTKSLLFSLIAVGSIFLLYFIIHCYIPSFNLMIALLIILSVLTLPHLSVMHGMYKNNNRNK